MIVVYPFSTVDQDLALKNAEWFNQLGGCKGHDCVMICDKRCVPELISSIFIELGKAFDKVERIPAEAEIDGWPEGANYFFRIAAANLQNRPGCQYFMWMEPDAIPLRKGWLDTIQEEYLRSKRPFMGDRVEVGDIPLHMSGVGIYPNPLHQYAGEAYRAHDLAWDMAAKDQIVPKAYFTKLIEHAWKHPRFGDRSEITTQIAPETILFHSSKDGSLIDLLREKNFPSSGPKPDLGASAATTAKAAIESYSTDGKPTYDIFIRTYPGDYYWLDYCLKSIEKYVSGFRKIWIVSPNVAPPIALPDNAEWKVMNDETEDGYLAQQITKLYGDVITDYQADYILHVDSDIIFTRPTTPEDFFKDGKMIWYYTPYDQIQTPWQPIIEKFMLFPMPFEYMRRLPMMIPRWLYARLREFAHHLHGMPISDYIRNQPQRAFSEFNAIGAYAHFHHRDKFTWIDTTGFTMPEPCAKQFHSWGGITPKIKSEIETILGGGELRGSTPTPKGPLDAAEINAASQIKKLSNGIWVLENDQISDWVIQEGRLDHDQNLLPDILKHIKPGDTVVDAGAFIGDHTIAYLNAVGKHGLVAAFEPNPLPFQCLKHNLGSDVRLLLYECALGDKKDTVPLSGNNGNYGGSYVGEHMKIDDIPVMPLDYYQFPANFIKIDVEGYELKVLNGAKITIERHQPIMVIEINKEALRRQGARRTDIRDWLAEHNYDWTIIQENASWGDPLFDILCIPKQPPAVNINGSMAHTSEPTPVAAPRDLDRDTRDTIKDLVLELKAQADADPKYKAAVMQQLVYAGLKKPNKKKKRNDPKSKKPPW